VAVVAAVVAVATRNASTTTGSKCVFYYKEFVYFLVSARMGGLKEGVKGSGGDIMWWYGR
jgi:hypothetical protein